MPVRASASQLEEVAVLRADLRSFARGRAKRGGAKASNVIDYASV